MSAADLLGPPAMGTGAAGNLALARDAASYCCKFTAIYDLLDNFTSPQVEATEVSINMNSTRSVRRGDKVKVPSTGAPRTRPSRADLDLGPGVLKPACCSAAALCWLLHIGACVLLQVAAYRDVGDILTIFGDGTGIPNMSQAFTIADSTKTVRRTDEIGRFGQALQHAPWHLGDDCFIMTV